VETEQVMIHKNHVCAFTMTRGSVPVFWSQETRYRYRPAPKLERRKLKQTPSIFLIVIASLFTYLTYLLPYSK